MNNKVFKVKTCLFYVFRLCDEVSNRQNNKVVPEGVRVLSRSPLKKNLVSHPLLQGNTFLTYRSSRSGFFPHLVE